MTNSLWRTLYSDTFSYLIAETTFCPAPGDDLNIDPRIKVDPRSDQLLYPENGFVCCHKEKVIGTLSEDPQLDESCEAFSDIGFRLDF